jgi:hypothetical protein
MGRSKRGGQKAAVVDDDDTEDILVTGDGGSNGAEDAKTLAADVAAMQAQLGLGGGGGGIGFDDRDFRPPSKKEVIVAAKVGATARRPARRRRVGGCSEPRDLCSIGATHKVEPAHHHVLLSIARRHSSAERIVRHPPTETECLLAAERLGWAAVCRTARARRNSRRLARPTRTAKRRRCLQE